jgi:hypothetical protein
MKYPGKLLVPELPAEKFIIPLSPGGGEGRVRGQLSWFCSKPQIHTWLFGTAVSGQDPLGIKPESLINFEIKTLNL